MTEDTLLDYPHLDWTKSTQSMSRKLLKHRGYAPCDAESYNAHSGRKKDQYGFIDMVGIKQGVMGVLGVQTTSYGHISERVKKAKGLDNYWLWLACGNAVEFHGWKTKYERGEKKIARARVIRVTRSPLYG